MGGHAIGDHLWPSRSERGKAFSYNWRLFQGNFGRGMVAELSKSIKESSGLVALNKIQFMTFEHPEAPPKRKIFFFLEIYPGMPLLFLSSTLSR